MQRLLIDAISPNQGMWDWVREIDSIRQKSESAVLVTVASSKGSTPREVGAKMMVLPKGNIRGTIGGGHLEQKAIEEALVCLDRKESKLIKFPLGAKLGQCCGGSVELFFELIEPPADLFIFGAGHVGQAVAKVLNETPIKVHLIDERPEWIDHEEIPASAIRHKMEWADFVNEAKWDDRRTFTLIMTHSHRMDQDILEHVLDRPTRYLGLIGSQAKWKRFSQRLSAKGVDPKKIEKVNCPIGLFDCGKSPKEVAISVAAQILKEHNRVCRT